MTELANLQVLRAGIRHLIEAFTGEDGVQTVAGKNQELART